MSASRRPVVHAVVSVKAQVTAWWAAFHTDPYTPAELAALRETPVKVRPIRRHRRQGGVS